MAAYSRAAAAEQERRLARTARYQQSAMELAGSTAPSHMLGASDGSRNDAPASFVPARDMIPLVGGNDYAIYFWSEMARIDAESEARGTQPGGVRDLDLVQQLPSAPPAGWFFNLVDAFIFWSVGQIATPAGGTSMYDEFWDAGGEVVQDFGSDPIWTWTDAGSELMDAGGNLATNVPVAETSFQVPQWLQTAGEGIVDFGADIGRRAVERFINQEIAEEFNGGGTRTVVQPRALPQENQSPLSGLLGWIYPQGQVTGSGTARGSVAGSGAGYGYYSPGSGASGSGQVSGGGISPTMGLALVAAAMVLIFGVLIFRR
jgi:hypothetical protein